MSEKRSVNFYEYLLKYFPEFIDRGVIDLLPKSVTNYHIIEYLKGLYAFHHNYGSIYKIKDTDTKIEKTLMKRCLGKVNQMYPLESCFYIDFKDPYIVQGKMYKEALVFNYNDKKPYFIIYLPTYDADSGLITFETTTLKIYRENKFLGEYYQEGRPALEIKLITSIEYIILVKDINSDKLPETYNKEFVNKFSLRKTPVVTRTVKIKP